MVEVKTTNGRTLTKKEPYNLIYLAFYKVGRGKSISGYPTSNVGY
jgi:hypothetical protein